MKQHEMRISLGGEDIIFETGKIARQANGSVVVRCGETMVLATACASASPFRGRSRCWYALTTRKSSHQLEEQPLATSSVKENLQSEKHSFAGLLTVQYVLCLKMAITMIPKFYLMSGPMTA